MNQMQTTISPVDNSVVAERKLAGERDIDLTFERAARAQREWRHVPLPERAAMCLSMVQFMTGKAAEIGKEITMQIGRPVRYAPNEIVGGFDERARHMISIAAESLSDIAAQPKKNYKRYVRREPLGVVLTLAPWNYPYLTSVNSVLPAIMAGNSVVLKHAYQTPLCAERYAEAFEAAGFPRGVFQILHMSHENVARSVADPRVSFVAFTGSVSGGHAVNSAASGRFIDLGLELGGNDPAYVRPDADMDFTISNLVDGAMFNSGQSCCGIERIYVHRDVFANFVDGYVDLVNKYTLGNPLDPSTTLGPMVRTAAAQAVRLHIDEAVARGATPLINERAFSASQAGTPYLAPQVLVNVDHSMRLMSEETFGPVVGIMSVQNDQEAVELMNDSAYGLTASIWTKDEDTATRLGDRVDTGTWYMNRCDYLDPALAWTGVKDSGRGCTLSSVGYERLTRPKSYHLRLETA